MLLIIQQLKENMLNNVAKKNATPPSYFPARLSPCPPVMSGQQLRCGGDSHSNYRRPDTISLFTPLPTSVGRIDESFAFEKKE